MECKSVVDVQYASLTQAAALVLEVNARGHRHPRLLEQRAAHGQRVRHAVGGEVDVHIEGPLRRGVLVRLHSHGRQPRHHHLSVGLVLAYVRLSLELGLGVGVMG